jgi:hypothetical protein
MKHAPRQSEKSNLSDFLAALPLLGFMIGLLLCLVPEIPTLLAILF